MTKFKYILGIDPSGNFSEGKGITGWCLMNDKGELIETGVIKATTYNRPEEYWNGHKNMIHHFIEKYKDDMIVVIENFILYKDKAVSQSNSQMETCRLIGLLQWYLWKRNIPYSLQRATDVKHRWSDDLLARERIIYKDNGYWRHTDSNISLSSPHVRDAFRHAIHYCRCRNELNTKKFNNKRGAFNDVRSNYQSRRW